MAAEAVANRQTLEHIKVADDNINYDALRYTYLKSKNMIDTGLSVHPEDLDMFLNRRMRFNDICKHAHPAHTNQILFKIAGLPENQANTILDTIDTLTTHQLDTPDSPAPVYTLEIASYPDYGDALILGVYLSSDAYKMLESPNYERLICAMINACFSATAKAHRSEDQSILPIAFYESKPGIYPLDK